jgi:outer membrane protein
MHARHTTLGFIAAAVLIILPTAGSAAQPLSLDEAIRSALTYNPELRAAGEQADAADSRAKGAWGALLPQLNARYMVRRSDNPLDAFADKLNMRTVDPATDFSSQALNNPDPSTIHTTQLSVELPLYTGGRIRAGIREAGAYAESARLAYERHREAIAYRTLHAYRSAQAAAQGLVIANDAVDAAREHAETTARLVRQGRIVASDRLTAELNHSAAESAREQASGRLRLALDELRLVMGLPAGTALELPSWQNPAFANVPANMSELEQRALANRKDLKAQDAYFKASRARVTAARSAFQPQVGVVAADSWYDSNAALDNKSQSIMGVVSMNLFSGGRDHHALSAAHHEADEAEQRLESMRQGARNEVLAAASRLTEARARMEIAGQSVDKARENVRLVKQRYGEGRTILIDLLMAERMLVEARSEALNAALGQELASAQLELAEGSLPLPGDAVAQTK